jgi:calcium-dependent protein kinase
LETKKIGDFNVKLVNFDEARMFVTKKYSKILAENKSNKNKQKLKEQISLESNFELTLGRLFFTAPEMLKGKVEYKSNLWSCGVLLYILLCGYPPFAGESEEDVINQIYSGKVIFKDDDWAAISKEA